MSIEEFISDFAKNHKVQHIDDISEGIIQSVIAEDLYLVKICEVSE